MESTRQFALITGATGGIGAETAELMASKKHDLILTARSEENLKLFACRLEETYKITAIIFQADLTAKKERDRLISFIRDNNFQIEFLINNAGFGDYGVFSTSKRSLNEKMIQVNITALTHFTREFLPDMLRRGHGRIMNVASMAGFMPGPVMSVYYASKAYVQSFSQAVAEEVRGSGVTVTALCPGPVSTDFLTKSSYEKAFIMKLLKPANPKDIARFGYKAMMKGKTMAIPGAVNRFLLLAVRLAPRRLIVSMLNKLHRKTSTPVEKSVIISEDGFLQDSSSR